MICLKILKDFIRNMFISSYIEKKVRGRGEIMTKNVWKANQVISIETKLKDEGRQNNVYVLVKPNC
ncbi:protein of unknown function [Paenibacillus alvei]|uniref:Uncharacterized protein n=1 Tax=Paenibacillus alvei TaxID=44250 RepID=A0A383R4E4_PAEAL|nr:protein of unknown function [Paenibacillus alvei]